VGILKTLVALLLLAACGAAQAESVRETDLKAAFVYNFMVLTRWPAGIGQSLKLCVAMGPVPAALEALAGKWIGERIVVITLIASPERTADCHVLHIPSSQAPRMKAWLAAVAASPTLTITEVSDAARQGSMVNLRALDGRVVFDVDTQAAAAVQLTLSSQLVKLAQVRH
jgi:hypothetical protein